jgi:hypothetical protein
MAELFGVERSVVTKHLKNIFESNELEYNSTCAKIALVQNEGNRQVKAEGKSLEGRCEDNVVDFKYQEVKFCIKG